MGGSDGMDGVMRWDGAMVTDGVARNFMMVRDNMMTMYGVP